MKRTKTKRYSLNYRAIYLTPTQEHNFKPFEKLLLSRLEDIEQEIKKIKELLKK